MRAIHRLLCTIPLLLSAGLALAQEARQGTHGMLLIVNAGGVIASHLPMYHSPHDVQVVLALTPASREDKEFIDTLSASTPEILYTISPEPFDLNRLNPEADDELEEFCASLYLGHFERGGRQLSERVCFSVDDTLLFRQIAANMAKEDKAHWLVFEIGADRYAAHEIAGAPDFDQWMRLTGGRKLDAGRFRSMRDNTIVGSDKLERGTKLNLIRDDGDKVEARVEAVLYRETSDLAK